MTFDLLETEKNNPDTWNIDQLPTDQMLAVMQREDEKVAGAVKQALPEIAAAVDMITDSMRSGGRLFYVGAGTSGRLGVLDAAECPPTFGTPPELVQALLAGGREAMFQAVEGAEDDAERGAADLRKVNLKSNDVVVGLAASGRTPYVVGALRYAKSYGCRTAAICCVRAAEMATHAEIFIYAPVGPEVIAGSTRLKAGTAQKMVLNMLSTATMIKLGKTYANQMVDVKATNAKLADRVKRIVRDTAQVEDAVAEDAVRRANGSAKTALVMLLGGISAEEAEGCLVKANGSVRLALEHVSQAREKLPANVGEKS